MHVIQLRPEELFRSLADPIRIRIIRLLVFDHEEACLCELVESLLEPEYKLSRHLKILRQAGVLSVEKQGKWVYHRLVRGIPYIDFLLRSVAVLPDKERLYCNDLKRFKKRLALRDNGRCHIGIQSRDLASKEA